MTEELVESFRKEPCSDSRNDDSLAAIPACSDNALPGHATQADHEPSHDFLSRIPHAFARQHLIISRGIHEGKERLATTIDTSRCAIFNVSVVLGRGICQEHAPAEAIASAIDHAYAQQAARMAARGGLTDREEAISLEESVDVDRDVRAVLEHADADLLNTSDKGPVVRLVDLLVFGALQKSASDVHIQPVADRVLVRYRMDGVLITVRELPLAMLAAIISRVKIMGRLDVAEQRAPQDGRATVTIGHTQDHARDSNSARRIDLRISTLPTTYGERLVIRILDTGRSPHLLRFASLGMPPDVEHRYLAQCSRTNGVVLVTGPTGSGKTTTLYTTLAWITSTHSSRDPSMYDALRSCQVNIMTIEDPVEYDLATAGLVVSQTQLNAKKKVTFAAGLRHILRQDPDVIMVGEIRDEETARVAVQASLTGHLVLSTLHTNDAAGAVARLMDLGVEPFLVSSSLAAVLAQRLVRKQHPPCKGAGCPECMHTGFQGRIGVFELLMLDEEIRHLVSARESSMTLKNTAVHKGMRTLRQAGEDLVASGMTSYSEISRIIEGLE